MCICAVVALTGGDKSPAGSAGVVVGTLVVAVGEVCVDSVLCFG